MTLIRGNGWTVVKLGGALLSRPDTLCHAIRALEGAASAGKRLLVVPGGGLFANAVRAADRSVGLPPDAAHWMAIMGMDQFAHLIAAKAASARLVHFLDEATAVHNRRELPVIAPYRWLRSADPLPHSWDVTSDSLAAWVANRASAGLLILVKPVSGGSGDLVDPYFHAALGRDMRVEVTDAAGLVALL